MTEHISIELAKEIAETEIKCPDCGGSGEFILSPGGCDMEGERCEPPEYERCELCMGTGQIKQGGVM